MVKSGDLVLKEHEAAKWLAKETLEIVQAFYYRLQLDKTCRKLREKYKFKYDINAILSDFIYARVLEPASKRSSYKTASEFLGKPSYQLHDLYRSLDVLGNESDFIQSEVYKNSHLLGVSTTEMMVSLKTDLRFSKSGQ